MGSQDMFEPRSLKSHGRSDIMRWTLRLAGGCLYSPGVLFGVATQARRCEGGEDLD